LSFLFPVLPIFALILALFTPPYLAGITAVPNEAFLAQNTQVQPGKGFQGAEAP
jgi:hypothetical protein